MKLLWAVLILAASAFGQDFPVVLPNSNVSGRGNLTTAGAVPYVSAAGTLSQDAAVFFWDATNDRLGIGTNAPIFPLSVTGKIGGMTYAGTYIDPSGTNLDVSSNANINFSSGAAGAGLLTGSSGNWSLGVAGLADRNFKLSVQKSGSSGTVEIYDITATTGNTLLSVYAGAGQGTSDMTRWYTIAGTKALWVDYGTALHGGSYYTLQYGDAKAIRLYNSGLLAWSSTSDSDSGSYDLGINRVSTRQQMEISNSTAGSTRDLRYRQAEVPVGTVASATTISGASYGILHVTGTTTIQTITAPSAFSDNNYGGCTVLIPDGLWATNTAGNIAIATTAVVSQALTMCYDHSAAKWYPSY